MGRWEQLWRNHKKVRDKNKLETRNNGELRRSKESEGRKRAVIKRKQRYGKEESDSPRWCGRRRQK